MLPKRRSSLVGKEDFVDESVADDRNAALHSAKFSSVSVCSFAGFFLLLMGSISVVSLTPMNGHGKSITLLYHNIYLEG